ncbi:MAG: metal ABC transporter permease, partial [Phycisphaerales bacterium JB059]
MRTIEYLSSPELASLYWPGVITGAFVGLLGGLLSVLVVLKRLAFIGQGVSHAAFGGVGLAFVLGVTGSTRPGALGLLGIVLGFSLAAAMGIAWLSGKRGTRTDTAIGVVLALSMALGFVLLREAGRRAASAGQAAPPDLESVLFGSVVNVGWGDAIIGGAALAFIGLTMFALRRPMLFWAFDESACEAFGTPGKRMKVTLLLLLALAVVVTVKLAGIVLATALFVLPGAIALRVSDRLGPVLVVSMVVGVVGVL